MALTVGRERRIDSGMGDADSRPRNAKRLDDVLRGVLRVREDDVTALRLLGVGVVHPHGSWVELLGIFERAEIVDHRRAHARPLRRIHPVGEVQDVEAADKSLRRRATEAAPRASGDVGKGHGDELALRGKTVQHLVEQGPAADADRPERDELMLAGRGLRHPSERAEHVVADARPRMREGRDVVRDPHGPV